MKQCCICNTAIQHTTPKQLYQTAQGRPRYICPSCDHNIALLWMKSTSDTVRSNATRYVRKYLPYAQDSILRDYLAAALTYQPTLRHSVVQQRTIQEPIPIVVQQEEPQPTAPSLIHTLSRSVTWISLLGIIICGTLIGYFFGSFLEAFFDSDILLRTTLIAFFASSAFGFIVSGSLSAYYASASGNSRPRKRRKRQKTVYYNDIY